MQAIEENKKNVRASMRKRKWLKQDQNSQVKRSKKNKKYISYLDWLSGIYSFFKKEKEVVASSLESRINKVVDKFFTAEKHDRNKVYVCHLHWLENNLDEQFIIDYHETHSFYILKVKKTAQVLFAVKINKNNLKRARVVLEDNDNHRLISSLCTLLNEWLVIKHWQFFYDGKKASLLVNQTEEKNCLNRQEFERLLEKWQQQPLTFLEKMVKLNNGPILSNNKIPFYIELIEDKLWFQCSIQPSKYVTNAIDHSNFINKKTPDIEIHFLRYFLLELLAINEEQDQSPNISQNTKASAQLQFPLDGGYGATPLPSEIVWVEKITGKYPYSGKEIIKFIDQSILSFFQPKTTFLHDDAKIKLIEGEVKIKVWKGIKDNETLYENTMSSIFPYSGSFTFERRKYSQDKEKYYKALEETRNTPIETLKKEVVKECNKCFFNQLTAEYLYYRQRDQGKNGNGKLKSLSKYVAMHKPKQVLPLYNATMVANEIQPDAPNNYSENLDILNATKLWVKPKPRGR